MKLAWAVSGHGMAARAVVEAQLSGLIETGIDTVISNDAAATESMRAYCSGKAIDFVLIDPASLESEMLTLQRQRHFDCMGLTFNRLIPQSVLDAFGGRIFNFHPSLLPMFPGLGSTRKALRSGVDHTGVTVHFIDGGIDTGPIIARRKIAIETFDDEASLGRRQFEAAVPLLLQTVRLFERGREIRFDDADQDLVDFAVGFCAAIPVRAR